MIVPAPVHGRPIYVLHVITGLGPGGAEGMLARLAPAMDRSRFRIGVVSLLTGEGRNKERLLDHGIAVHEIGMDRARPSLSALLQLRHVVRREAPDLIHAWMYHAILAAILAAQNVPVIANVRANLDGNRDPFRTRALVRLGAWFSPRAARMCYVSETGRLEHERIGYARGRSLVIGNGFDCERLKRDPSISSAVRAEWKFGEERIVFGNVGRFHPVKNQAGLIRAFARVARQNPAVSLVLAGEDVDAGNVALNSEIVRLNLQDQVILLGQRRDVGRVMNGFDVFVSSSFCEGFPNVIGEAMATGVPCVATDAGDSRIIIGDTGTIVPCGQEAALASAMLSMAGRDRAERRRLGEAARTRIVESFSLPAIASRYSALYGEVVKDPWGKARS